MPLDSSTPSTRLPARRFGFGDWLDLYRRLMRAEQLDHPVWQRWIVEAQSACIGLGSKP